MPEVKCTVSNCEYWGVSNVCTADQILITAGPTAGKDKHGSGAERMNDTPVAISEHTYCWTMTPSELAELEEEDYVGDTTYTAGSA